MALTAEGRELTEANRLAQLAIAARAMAVSSVLWDGVDVGRLDQSTARWMPAQLAVLRRFHNDSNRVAGEYLRQYRLAEVGQPGDPIPGVFDTAEMRNTMLLAGPVRTKLLIANGMEPDEAKAGTFVKLGGMVRRQVLDGGRGSVNRTERGDRRAKGWRRVSDRDPCTFCAMLCARGPVYGSEQKANQVGGSGLQFHGHCGCTAEIIYGEWTPTETEQTFVNAYDAAAAEADAAGQSRMQSTILYRMRRDGSFKDSPKIRNANSAA
ncbi:hypothetical protein [Arthrobacter sp. 260]|uniref:VG15 protein n=1 Tax=Arthrobacter sp. 260 TaxID=2735314 RepID=UPI001491CB2E|nr:hypothetical protein [Arthrobacter sp. 260]NOJ59751.1 hypothetical protein [Arthrobacter sp. 260]